MPRYQRLAAISLNVSDLQKSTAFYAALPGLRRHPGTDEFAIGTGGMRLALTAGDAPGLKAIAFEMETERELGELARMLERRGVPCHAATGDAAGFAIVEPSLGCAVEFRGPPPDERPVPGPIAGLGHVVLRTARYPESLGFWRDLLGFRLSDEVSGRMAFLRCPPNPFHHSLALVAGARTGLHHVSFRGHDDTDLNAFAEHLRAFGASIFRGPGRHVPSGSRFVYFGDPDGLTLELSCGMERFDSKTPRPPRSLPANGAPLDDDPAPRDPRMFTSGHIEVCANSG